MNRKTLSLHHAQFQLTDFLPTTKKELEIRAGKKWM
jgi:hypothetical protein